MLLVTASRQVVVGDNGVVIVLTIDSQRVLVNGKQILVDCPAELHPPGRTFVTLRFVNETLGTDVHWDRTTQNWTIER